jgi:hypothetical protein
VQLLLAVEAGFNRFTPCKRRRSSLPDSEDRGYGTAVAASRRSVFQPLHTLQAQSFQSPRFRESRPRTAVLPTVEACFNRFTPCKRRRSSLPDSENRGYGSAVYYINQQQLKTYRKTIIKKINKF